MSRSPRILISLHDYVSPNYGRAKMLDIAGYEFYFSYETPIATAAALGSPVVTDEAFNPTTAKHKACIPHHKIDRVPRDVFDSFLRVNLSEAVKKLIREAEGHRHNGRGKGIDDDNP